MGCACTNLSVRVGKEAHHYFRETPFRETPSHPASFCCCPKCQHVPASLEYSCPGFASRYRSRGQPMGWRLGYLELDTTCACWTSNHPKSSHYCHYFLKPLVSLSNQALGRLIPEPSLVAFWVDGATEMQGLTVVAASTLNPEATGALNPMEDGGV